MLAWWILLLGPAMLPAMQGTVRDRTGTPATHHVRAFALADASTHTLSGTIYGGSNPLAGARLELFDTSRTTVLATTITDSDGNYTLYQFKEPCTARCIMKVAAMGYRPSPLDLSEQENRTMKAYSFDLRERVVGACRQGQATRTAIARTFSVSTRWIRKLFQRLRQSGSCAALPPSGGAPVKCTAKHDQRLIKAVQKKPDATLDQLRHACRAPVSRQTICQHLKKLGLRRKKKHLRASERDRPDVQAQRAAWGAEMAAVDPQKLVFEDELGAQTTLTPLYGRAPAGVRVEEGVPADHWHTRTLVEAVRLDGPCAAMELEGPLDGASFRVWVEKLLLPCLRSGDIVVWDNLHAHQAAKAEELLAKAKATLAPLPPYSPDLNPIEPMGGKVKQFLRQAKARTGRALTKAIARALQTVTGEDIRNWFAHCGYRYTVP